MVVNIPEQATPWRLARVDPRCVTTVMERGRARFEVGHVAECTCGAW